MRARVLIPLLLCLLCLAGGGVLLFEAFSKQIHYREKAIHEGKLVNLIVGLDDTKTMDVDGSKRVAALHENSADQSSHGEVNAAGAHAQPITGNEASLVDNKVTTSSMERAESLKSKNASEEAKNAESASVVNNSNASVPAVVGKGDSASVPAVEKSGGTLAANPKNNAQPGATIAGKPLKPKIAIMVVGLGLRQESADLAMQLPAELGFGFSPYGSFTAAAAKTARAKGHEIFMHIPLELASNAKEDAGPFALLTSLDPDENVERLKYMLSMVEQPQGVYLTKEEVFTNSLEQSQRLLEELKERKLLLAIGDYDAIDFASLARSMALPTVVNHLWIDDELSQEAIQKNLNSLPRLAKEFQNVLAMVRPYPLSIRLLQEWLDNIATSDVTLVPASVLVPKTDPRHKTASPSVVSPANAAKQSARQKKVS